MSTMKAAAICLSAVGVQAFSGAAVGEAAAGEFRGAETYYGGYNPGMVGCEYRQGCTACAEWGVCVWVSDQFGNRCSSASMWDDCAYSSMHCEPSACPNEVISVEIESLPVVVEPMGYKVIDSYRSCEKNNEGITRIFGSNGFDLVSCSDKCSSQSNCVAIDYYESTGWCNTYDQICNNPLETKDGASSFTKQTGTQTTGVTCNSCVTGGGYYDHAAGYCVPTQGSCQNMYDISSCIPPYSPGWC